jgi:hypothetical protein
MARTEQLDVVLECDIGEERKEQHKHCDNHAPGNSRTPRRWVHVCNAQKPFIALLRRGEEQETGKQRTKPETKRCHQHVAGEKAQHSQSKAKNQEKNDTRRSFKSQASVWIHLEPFSPVGMTTDGRAETLNILFHLESMGRCNPKFFEAKRPSPPFTAQ